MNGFLAGAVLFALAPDPTQSTSTPSEVNSAADSSQRGSRGSTAGGDERTGPPAAGIESGDANGMAGGRTHEGPRGGTGHRGGGAGIQKERARGKGKSRSGRHTPGIQATCKILCRPSA